MYIFGLCKLPVHELWSTVLPTVEVYPHLTRSSTRQPRSAGTFLSYIQHKSLAHLGSLEALITLIDWTHFLWHKLENATRVVSGKSR
jgi:hypothetical protein